MTEVGFESAVDGAKLCVAGYLCWVEHPVL